MLTIFKDQGCFARDVADLDGAVRGIERHLADYPKSVFTVASPDGDMIASIAGADIRIMGELEEVEESRPWFVMRKLFDATEAVLRMPYEQVVALADGSPQADALGRQLTGFQGGASRVKIGDALAEYFGADNISRAHFEFVRDRVLTPVDKAVRVDLAVLMLEDKIGVVPDPMKGWVARSYMDATEFCAATPQAAVLACWTANHPQERATDAEDRAMTVVGRLWGTDEVVFVEVRATTHEEARERFVEALASAHDLSVKAIEQRSFDVYRVIEGAVQAVAETTSDRQQGRPHC